MLSIPEFSVASRLLFAAIAPAFVFASLATGFEGSEEAGGSVTGPIQHLLNIGADLLLASLITSAWMPRSAALLCGLGAVFCLPNYSYGWAPGFYRWMFPGEYSHFDPNTLEFAPFDIIGTLTLIWVLWIASQTIRYAPTTIGVTQARQAYWTLPLPELALETRSLFAAIAPAYVLAYVLEFLNVEPQFITGTMTGTISLLQMKGAETLLISLVLSPWQPRAAALLCMLGGLLCVPLYAWGAMRGLHAWAFPGEYSTPPIHFFGTDVLSVVGGCATWICICRARDVVAARADLNAG
jgi:hypothetical protein